MSTIKIGKAFVVFHDRGFFGRLPSGHGIALDYPRKTERPLFSERNGFRKVHRWAGFRFEVLKP